jgi:AraC family transcriptional regulator
MSDFRKTALVAYEGLVTSGFVSAASRALVSNTGQLIKKSLAIVRAVTPCAYCGRPAVAQIPTIPRRVCQEHAEEYSTRRPDSASRTPVDDTQVSHHHLTENSSIPSFLSYTTDSLAIARLESSIGLADPITKVSSVPALLVSVSIKSKAVGDYHLWLDDKPVPTFYTPPFRSAVLDFEAQPKCLPGKAFDYVLFHVPRKGLDDIAADLAVDPVETFKVSLDEEDLVLAQLTKSILPFIGRPHWFAPLTLDHLTLVLGAHLLQKYAGRRTLPTVSVGGLAPSQKRRATELLSENLAGRVRLAQLAQECGLSVSHFARSFKASFGVSTHQWLVQRRIEHSQDLLMRTCASLTDIAEKAGFSDQAAFTRVFHRIVGVSPGRWKRDRQRKEIPVAVSVPGH